MKFSMILITALFITSCVDDDFTAPLEYTICGNEIMPKSERLEEVNLDLIDWPEEVRSYINSEFSGYIISGLTSYKDESKTKFQLATMDNGGLLLFDSNDNFVCGDDSFRYGSGNDEHVKIEDLLQVIKDYISTNYPDRTIKKAEFEDGEYSVELDNKLQLCFTTSGNFKGEC